MLSTEGHWVIRIYPVEPLTQDVDGLMVMVGTGGSWLDPASWGYACTPDQIAITVFNDSADGAIPVGWMYKVVVMRGEGQ